jgi:hypothetical protein
MTFITEWLIPPKGWNIIGRCHIQTFTDLKYPCLSQKFDEVGDSVSNALNLWSDARRHIKEPILFQVLMKTGNQTGYGRYLGVRTCVFYEGMVPKLRRKSKCSSIFHFFTDTLFFYTYYAWRPQLRSRDLHIHEDGTAQIWPNSWSGTWWPRTRNYQWMNDNTRNITVPRTWTRAEVCPCLVHTTVLRWSRSKNVSAIEPTDVCLWHEQRTFHSSSAVDRTLACFETFRPILWQSSQETYRQPERPTLPVLISSAFCSAVMTPTPHAPLPLTSKNSHCQIWCSISLDDNIGSFWSSATFFYISLMQRFSQFSQSVKVVHYTLRASQSSSAMISPNV